MSNDSDTRPIQITYDARMIGSSGIGTQILNVLRLLSMQPGVKLHLLGDPDQFQALLPAFQGTSSVFKAAIYRFKEQLRHPGPASAQDWLHCPHYNAPVWWLSNSIVVVHDLIHLQSREFAGPHYRLYAWILLRLISRRARHIICVSETTRLELVKRFPEAAGRTSVIYNGINHSLFRKQSSTRIRNFRTRYQLPSRYLLCVGIGKRHKNVDFIVRSLAPLWHRGQLQYPLVLAGTGGKLPDYVAEAVQTANCRDWIIVLPYLDEAELPLMYASAWLFLFPSRLEGFGFPMIEAMASGCPVLASQASCLPEIGADAARYFHPADETALQQLLLKVLKAKSERKNMIAEGFRRARDFSWQQHVEQLLAIYASLHQEKR
ncbi:MAG: glycosyltransferase family 4 protein [Leptospiraceae bacterium]|nr:glycosyltransferase family 4 protein [Leptospiraceae bacterium]